MNTNSGSKEEQKPGMKFLGVELGSTRIKAVLIDESHRPIASGSHEWENQFENGVWTYRLEDVWAGLQDCYQKLGLAYSQTFQEPLTSIDALGISAMMHGYMAFDRTGNLLVPFRTWRNTMTAPAAEKLSHLFQFNIPQRWSIAHLYQAILNQEPHVRDIASLTTLAGYIHWKLTGRLVLGIGDASGVFPIDSARNNYDEGMVDKFHELISGYKFPWKLEEILPEVVIAGGDAGKITPEGAKLLDPSGLLKPGIPVCPPEGDAGTGMVATNSVAERTCNVSAGTSIFAMVVLEKPLSQLYPEIDLVTTPSGKPVAMVHANTCTSDLNAWVDLFGELTQTFGLSVDPAERYTALFTQALKGDPDCGGLLTYNFYSGEPIAHLEKGAPLFVRTPESHLNLANFMRVLLFSALGTLKMGMNILFEWEKVKVDQMLGHGGFFKTKDVGQRIMAAALNVPVSIMETAGEGGAWGIALLAAYRARKTSGQTLEDYLSNFVFASESRITVYPDPGDVAGFNQFMSRYEPGLEIEKKAVEILRPES